MRSIPPTLTALPLLAGALSAQSLQVYQGFTLREDWTPAVPTAAPFLRSAAGEVSGDGTPDVLLVDGERAVLLFDIDVAYAPVDVPATVADACLVPAHLADGRAVVVTVSGAGASAWSFDPANGAFAEHVLAAGAWAGARAVRSADLDGSGRADLVGVAADGRTLLVLSAGVGEYGFSPAAGFVAADDVLDVVPLQWDYDAPLELAVLCPSGVYVHDASGVVLSLHPAILPGGTIARIAQEGQTRDRLAWITAWAPPAQQWLLTLSSLGVEAQLDLGALDAVAALGADFDHDGDEDLLISHRYSYDLLWLKNLRCPAQPACESFLGCPDGSLLFRVGPADPGALENRAWPALADFDRDGDIDIAVGNERTQKLVYVRGNWADEGLRRPGVASASCVSGLLELQVSAPAALDPAATHLEVDVWTRAAPAAEVDGPGVAHVRVPLPAQWPATVALALDPQAVLQQAHYVRVRTATLAAGGSLEREFPSWIGALVASTPWSDALLAEESAALLAVDGPAPENGGDETRIVGRHRTRRFRNSAPPVSSSLVPGGS